MKAKFSLFELMHEFGRSCLNCESWRSGKSLFCPDCERELLQEGFACEASYQMQDLSCLSLFQWTPDENRRLSLLLKQLKGGTPREAFSFWGEKLLLQVPLEKLEFFKTQKVVLVPAPPRAENERDHALALAEVLSEITKWPVKRGLARSNRLSTKSLTRSQRGKISFVRREKITQNSYVIFVDDILTTGSTALAAKRTIGRIAGFEVWTVARRRQLATGLHF